jgi:hypothetical protein
MSLRTLVGLSIWPALFLLALATSVRLLPVRPLMTVVTENGPTFASLSPDGKLLMTQTLPGSDRAYVTDSFRLWSVPDGREHRLAGPGRKVPDSANNPFPSFSRDGRFILDRRFLSERKTTSLRFIEVGTGEEWLHVESVSPCPGCFSADGRKLACYVTDHVEVWDVPNRRTETTLKAGPCFAISADGATALCDVALALGPNEVNEEMALWDVAGERELSRITVLNRTSWQVEFSPDGKSLGFSCMPLNRKGGFFRVWDVDSGRLKIDMPWVSTFAFVLGGKALATTGGLGANANSRVSFWDSDTGQELGGLPLGPAGDIVNASLRSSSDGHWLAVDVSAESPQPTLPKWAPRWKWLSDLWNRSSSSMQVILLDAATKQERGRINGSSHARYEFSTDNSSIVVAGFDGGVEVWSLPPRKPVWLAAALAAALLGVVWAVRLGYRRFRRRGASAVGRSLLNCSDVLRPSGRGNRAPRAEGRAEKP